jgi:hypothetical protein
VPEFFQEKGKIQKIKPGLKAVIAVLKVEIVSWVGSFGFIKGSCKIWKRTCFLSL